MAARLNRNLGRATALESNEWTDRTMTGRPAVSCPGCGSITELGSEFLIDRDGRVAPAWQCGACHFHEYIRLSDWGEEILA